MSHDCVVGQTRAGSWGTACTHPACGFYQSGAPSRHTAEERGGRHTERSRRGQGLRGDLHKRVG